MNSSSQSNAMAGILKSFLPVHDKLERMKEKYANDDFGSQYGGLWMGPTLDKMGVKEYNVAEGDLVDRIRMNVVASEHSAAPKDTVIAQVAPGMELEGNVVRAATCIISRGNEADATTTNPEDPAQETSAETDS
jgi:molecular chaperone GrpE (heat shock protein)